MQDASAIRRLHGAVVAEPLEAELVELIDAMLHNGVLNDNGCW